MMGSTHPHVMGISIVITPAKSFIILSSFLLLHFCFLEPIHIYNSSVVQKVTSESFDKAN